MEICTPLQKGPPGRNRQSIARRAMALQPPGRGAGNGDRARPSQGTAGALRALSLTQRNPPGGSSRRAEGGPVLELPSWAFPARGRGETEGAPSDPAAVTAVDPGPLPWPPRPAAPANQPALHLAEAPTVVQRGDLRHLLLPQLCLQLPQTRPQSRGSRRRRRGALTPSQGFSLASVSHSGPRRSLTTSPGGGSGGGVSLSIRHLPTAQQRVGNRAT